MCHHAGLADHLEFLVQPAVLLVRRHTGRNRVWPTDPLQPRRQLVVSPVGIIAAVAADELEGVGVAAFWPAFYDAGRLAAQNQRPAIGALITARHVRSRFSCRVMSQMSVVVWTRPALAAAWNAAQSSSFWSAYFSAKSATAWSNLSEPPR